MKTLLVHVLVLYSHMSLLVPYTSVHAPVCPLVYTSVLLHTIVLWFWKAAFPQSDPAVAEKCLGQSGGTQNRTDWPLGIIDHIPSLLSWEIAPSPSHSLRYINHLEYASSVSTKFPRHLETFSSNSVALTRISSEMTTLNTPVSE